MAIQLEIYKDKFLGSKIPWRANVTLDNGIKFKTGMYRTKKALIERFDGFEITKITRNQSLDSK